MTDKVRSLALQKKADVIMVHNRMLIGPLLRYMSNPPAQIRIWPGDKVIRNHFELKLPLSHNDGPRVLYVTYGGQGSSVPGEAKEILEKGSFTVPLMSGKNKSFSWYLLNDFGDYGL